MTFGALMDGLLTAFMTNPVAQAFGVLAYGASAWSVLQKSEDRLRLYMAISALIWAAHHFLMASYVATVMFVVIALRCYLSAVLLKQVLPVRLFVALVFMGINAIGTCVTWDGTISLFAFAAATVATIAVLLTTGLWTRLLLVSVEMLWLVYNVHVGSFGGVLACLTDGGILIYVLFTEYVFKSRRTSTRRPCCPRA